MGRLCWSKATQTSAKPYGTSGRIGPCPVTLKRWIFDRIPSELAKSKPAVDRWREPAKDGVD